MLSNPLYDPFQILTKIYSDGAHLKQAIADTYIEELNRGRTVKIVYGVLENNLWLDYAIKFYAPKSPKLAVRILLKISLYMLLFMDKQKYMVTNCAVDLCKKLGKGGVSGFVNAFLRRFDKAAVDSALQKEKDGESISLSYPAYAYKWLKQEYGDRAKLIAAAVSGGVSVRFADGNLPEQYAKNRIRKLRLRATISLNILSVTTALTKANTPFSRWGVSPFATSFPHAKICWMRVPRLAANRCCSAKNAAKSLPLNSTPTGLRSLKVIRRVWAGKT